MKAIVPEVVAARLQAKLIDARVGLQILPMISSDALLPEMSEADIFLYHYAIKPEIIPRLIRNALKLKWIHSVSAGVDQLLFQELLESSVILTNSAGAHAPNIAESVMGMLLFVVKHLGEHWNEQRIRRWNKQENDELFGKTLGIIGLGHVGSELARRAKAFGMRVIATKSHPEPFLDADQIWGAEHLHRLLAEADYAVLCAPLTKETAGMIGEAELRRMKPTAYFINIARGPLVNEDAMLRALRERWIAGACLDVFVQEPLPPGHPFWDLPNVFITPHNAAATPQQMGRSLDIFVDNVKRYREGKDLVNVVDKKRGY